MKFDLSGDEMAGIIKIGNYIGYFALLVFNKGLHGGLTKNEKYAF